MENNVNNSSNYIIPSQPDYFYCEHKTPEGWEPIKTKDLSWVSEQLTLGNLRVPKLSGDDLEELGWKKTHNLLVQCYIKDKKYLLYLFENNPVISIDSLHGNKQLFRGFCPTINEFLTLTKMLGI